MCVVPRHCSKWCHADVGGARPGCGGPFRLWHAPFPGTFPRELKCFAWLANDAGVTSQHHSPDICHAGAVFEQDTHVRVAFDVGNFARPISHTHDDVAAKAKVSKGYGVRESVRVDGAQYRPAWAAIEIRLNLFVTEFSWHEKRLTKIEIGAGHCGSATSSLRIPGQQSKLTWRVHCRSRVGYSSPIYYSHDL